MLWTNTTQNAKKIIFVQPSAEEICTVYANLLNGPTIYRKQGNANMAWTYIDTDSHKLKQLKVKIVIIICQTSNQSATMEQNYCSSKSIF